MKNATRKTYKYATINRQTYTEIPIPILMFYNCLSGRLALLEKLFLIVIILCTEKRPFEAEDRIITLIDLLLCSSAVHILDHFLCSFRFIAFLKYSGVEKRLSALCHSISL